MNDKERLQLEEELLMTCSKVQAINKYIDELEESSKLSELWCKSQQENSRLKDKMKKANVLTKRIKDDIWERMAECYENEDNWNGDFLNIEINSIDRLLEMLKEN